jgi:uncharacterized protein YbjQ (UPF0145 family)
MPMEGEGENCPRCKKGYAEAAAPRPPAPPPPPKAPTDPIGKAWFTRDFSALTPEQRGDAALRVHITTLEQDPGFTIVQTLGIVSGCYTMAFGAVAETFGAIGRAIVGSGRSFMTESHLDDGILQATLQLRANAMQRYVANGVVGIRYQFEEFSGANNRGVLTVIATGTAVRMEPKIT